MPSPLDDLNDPYDGDDTLSPADPDGADSIEILLSECLVRFESEGVPAVEEILEREPGHAQALRERIATLERFGLFDASDPCDHSGQPPLETIGDFELVKKIGSGGMGVVYLAQDKTLGRLVALKVIRRGFTGSERARARFEREAKAVARLRHPHIVQVYQTGQIDGVDWIAMEFVPGQGLDELLAQAATGRIDLPLPKILGWVRDIAYALEAAHAQGIIHRDIKPSNIHITPDGHATLLDFGLAADLDAGAMTRTGSFQGSPYYASPEQIDPKKGEVGPLSDLYSLGTTLYEAAAGRVPFEGKTTEQVFHQVLSGAPKRPRTVNRHVSRDLETVILKAVEKDPRQRYASMAALAEDLQCVLDFRPIHARPARWVDKGRKWAKRNKGLAAAMGIAMASLLSLPIFAIAYEHSAAQVRSQQATASLGKARDRVGDLARIRVDTMQKRIALHDRLGRYSTRHVTTDDELEIANMQREVSQSGKKRLSIFYETLTHLSEAEKLLPESPEPRRIRADLYMERWRSSSLLIRKRKYLAPKELQIAREETQVFRSLVESVDEEKRYATELAGKGRFIIDLGAAQGTVHLFRFREQSELQPDGDQRLVPVALIAPKLPPGLAPGTISLRCETSGQGLEPEDVIFEVAGHPIDATVLLAKPHAGLPLHARLLSIDGRPVRRIAELSFLAPRADGSFHRFCFVQDGHKQFIEAASLEDLGVTLIEPLALASTQSVRIKAYAGGKVKEFDLEPGLVLRKTACPLLYDASRPFCGTSPIEGEVEQGNYLALVLSEGNRPIRCILEIHEGERAQHSIDTFTEAEVPPGYRLIHRSRSAAGSRLFLMDREVTCGEYLEFLNRPETLAFITGSPIPTRFPRFTENAKQGGFWSRTSKDGPYEIPSHWRSDWPILGISWNDAKAYTQWKTDLATKAGRMVRYRLPDTAEWAKACWSEGFFVFGNQFRQRWICSCNSLPKPGPEPILSYCVDESPLGLFDLSGSAFEYAEGWFWKERRKRPLMGGSWAMADPDRFRANFLIGAGEDAAWDTYGFRMLMEEQDG